MGTGVKKSKGRMAYKCLYRAVDVGYIVSPPTAFFCCMHLPIWEYERPGTLLFIF